MHTNNWFPGRKARPNSCFRLICVPYAGGGASVYRSWPELLPTWVEVCSIQLPGRENRIKETPFRHMDPLVEALTDAVLPLLNKPFAVFGHSMGAQVGFELVRTLQNRHGLQASHLFVSACAAPGVAATKKQVHRLPKEEFIDHLRLLHGTPEAVLNDEEMMNLLLDTLRADFAVCETHICPSGQVLECPISSYAGSEDAKVTLADAEGWGAHTRSAFSTTIFPGDHFFLHSCRSYLLSRISEALIAWVEHSRSALCGS